MHESTVVEEIIQNLGCMGYLSAIATERDPTPNLNLFCFIGKLNEIYFSLLFYVFNLHIHF